LAACTATCRAPATCTLDASGGCQNYACHTPADCFSTPQCFGLCGVNQTCSFVGGSAPCAATGAGYACRDVNATCFTGRTSGNCPAGTVLAYDFARRACTSNGSAYNIPNSRSTLTTCAARSPAWARRRA
jgi:hypothetical protein